MLNKTGLKDNNTKQGTKDGVLCHNIPQTTNTADEIGNNHLGVYKQPYSPRRLCDCKSGVCIPNWLNNLEPVTLHQEIKGAAQSEYSDFFLPQLYIIRTIRSTTCLHCFLHNQFIAHCLKVLLLLIALLTKLMTFMLTLLLICR